MKMQLAILGVALIGLSGLGYRYVVAPLKAEIRQAQADLEQAREAQRVADAYVLGAERREADLNERIEAALTGTYGGCADAPIDPALLRAVNGL